MSRRSICNLTIGIDNLQVDLPNLAQITNNRSGNKSIAIGLVQGKHYRTPTYFVGETYAKTIQQYWLYFSILVQTFYIFTIEFELR